MKSIRTYLYHIILALVLCILLTDGSSQAQTFPDGLIGLSSEEPAVLYSINASSGDAAPLLAINSSASITGISFLNRTLYGVDLFPGVTNEFFFGSISTNGTVTELGNQNFSSNWWGLASDEVNGVLYSIDTEKNDVLVAQNPNGSFTNIGSGTGTDGAGMAYDNTHGILYALDSDGTLYTVSTSTGTSTEIGPTGIQSTNDLGLAYDECGQILYANNGDIGQLYTIDVTSGVATLVGSNNTEDTIDGLAWKGLCGPGSGPIINPIPTLSEWGLIAMAGILGIFGLFAALRKRKVTA